ncbi:MAG TPA: hypothetical protein VHZ52_11310 [Acidobacteriaceae bacterium]|jgi:hypothetical protein|nr:hypothetical protein [Acidobacteriaceae bacterium]
MLSCRSPIFASLALALAVLPALVPAAKSSQSPAPTAQVAPTQSTPPSKSADRNCISAADAAQEPNLNREICVSAHVYDVVELADGTRFLDICPADVSDERCRFTFLSLRQDRDDVGDLTKYRDQEVHVRGIVRATHGRMGIVISHVRQFRGGPEKFRPNPRLLRDFNGQSDRMPVRDPNLAPTGRHRSFMDNRDRENLPARK